MKHLLAILAAVLLSMRVWGIDYKTERIFLAPLATEYVPGDSVEVSGMVLSSDSARSPYSRYLYMEVIDRADSVLLRQKLSCDSHGRFHHRFRSDLLWQPDIYYVRAYTRLMQNFGAKTFPVVPVQIGKRAIQPEGAEAELECAFYPEGGTLLSNALQHITVALKDRHGFPLSLPYCVVSEGDTVCRQRTTLSGLQQLRLYVQKGKRYELHARLGGKDYRFPLPESREGIAVQAVVNRSRVSYRILSSAPLDLAGYRLYACHPDWGVNKVPLLQPDGIINMEGASQGILSLSLLDRGNKLVSQRNLWIGKREETSALQGLSGTYAPGEEIHLKGVALQDTGKQVFCRVVKDSYWCAPHAESSLLWLGDLSSPLAFPLYYYREPAADRSIDLDAWMATAGFVGFDLPSVLAAGFSYPYPFEQALVLEGRVETRGGKPVNGKVIAYHADSGDAYEAETDRKGRFYIPVDDFKEGDRFFLQAYAGKKKDRMDFFEYKMKEETFPAVANRFRVRKAQEGSEVEVEFGHTGAAYGLDKNNLLPEVKVKAKAKAKAKRSVSSKYLYKRNYMDAAYIADRHYARMEDVINDFPAITLRSLTDVLPDYWNLGEDEDAVSQEVATLGQYILTSIRPSGVMNNGEKEKVKVLLDNMHVRVDDVLMLHPLEVESIEYLSPHEALAVTSEAISGALVVKTRKAGSILRKEVKSKGFVYAPMGVANSGSAHPSAHPKAPQERGRYRLLVDIVSAGKEVTSFDVPFEVK